jgi:hypothetical protein
MLRRSRIIATVITLSILLAFLRPLSKLSTFCFECEQCVSPPLALVAAGNSIYRFLYDFNENAVSLKDIFSFLSSV